MASAGEATSHIGSVLFTLDLKCSNEVAIFMYITAMLMATKHFLKCPIL